MICENWKSYSYLKKKHRHCAKHMLNSYHSCCDRLSNIFATNLKYHWNFIAYFERLERTRQTCYSRVGCLWGSQHFPSHPFLPSLCVTLHNLTGMPKPRLHTNHMSLLAVETLRTRNLWYMSWTFSCTIFVESCWIVLKVDTGVSRFSKVTLQRLLILRVRCLILYRTLYACGKFNSYSYLIFLLTQI